MFSCPDCELAVGACLCAHGDVIPWCAACDSPLDECICDDWIEKVADPRGLLSEPHDGTLRQP
jgi:hypothetical protein